MPKSIDSIALTDEQNLFIKTALSGKNILVDACVGSGKTTSIQALCCRYPKDKRILYLTYNRLLKIDAKAKINEKNVTVTNYHGYAYGCLRKMDVSPGISDSIQMFNRLHPKVGHFNLIVIDEYQDISQEIADMLTYIVEMNPTAQLIAVGDMKQKIYDFTTLDVEKFIDRFLGKHITLEFTKCFRLSSNYAQSLERMWQKQITGVNDKCKISVIPDTQIVDFLARQNPGDILCLGARSGMMTYVLNELELLYKDKFNKSTVYASISDYDNRQNIQPDEHTAIFTTFDSSKGLERDICVIFDFTESYWYVRLNKPQQRYEILRNIFLVAASRGKKQIVFVPGREEILSEETICAPSDMNMFLDVVDISGMFDFKYAEDIEDCYALLNTWKIAIDDDTVIKIRGKDELIDLSPCIGIYQEAFYFENYNIDRAIDQFFSTHKDKLKRTDIEDMSMEQKVLYLTALETNQQRYFSQVSLPLVTENQQKQLSDRLGIIFSHTDEEQTECIIPFGNEDGSFAFLAQGLADVVKDDIVYELKFVEELNHVHYLQCACYMIALNLEKGVLWNTRTNEMWGIEIPDVQRFMDAVTKAVTKRMLTKYYCPKGEENATADSCD